MRRLIAVYFTSLLCLVELALSPAAIAQDVPFKVYITSLWQLDLIDSPPAGLKGDYYAKVTINGVTQNNYGACDDGFSLSGLLVPFQLFDYFNRDSECSAATPWVFSQQVPASQPVHVTIEIWDKNEVLSDSEADAKPGSGLAVELDVDPVTGKWSGSNGYSPFDWPNDCSRPNFDLGGGRVNVCWQASFDTDDDGLLDVWEMYGVDTNNDGVIDIDLPALGANPQRKDLFVEADYLVASDHSHAPKKDAINSVVKSFANAPVTTNPDGTMGVQLHVDTGPLYGAGSVFAVTGTGGVTGTYGDLGGGGDAIPEAGNEIIDGFHDPVSGGTKFADLKTQYFNSLREPIFRYAIFGHQTNARAAANDCTSGVASSMPGFDFLVTLGGVGKNGGACWDTDGSGKSVGSTDMQGHTFMHELGHTLGLHHGGNVDTPNFKPNYLSVMNYDYQQKGVPSTLPTNDLVPGGYDYSRLVKGAVVPDLDETNLDECLGIDSGVAGFGSFNFNGDKDVNGNDLIEGASKCVPTAGFNVTADINFDGVCVTPGANGTIDTVLGGDDVIFGVPPTIIDDGNRFCDTTADSSTDDQQSTAKGFTPPQPNVLKSFDDWDNLRYSLLTFDASNGGSGTSPVEEEADPTVLRQAQERLSAMSAPKITVDETGPATGKPGDLLTYSIVVKNQGGGPALSSVLSKTAPDGTSQTSDIGIIAVGNEVSQTSDFTVPSTACPGDFTGVAASLAFKDLAGDNLTASGSAPLQILDVAPPTLDVSVSPAMLWPPDHKFQDVTATITVKDNCDPNPSVTLASVTSNEPATGFLGNGDKGPDIEGADIGTDVRIISLRSERGTGQGSTGRVYTITYRATDRSGNFTERTATVTVPTSNSGK
jgi:uncharacterized repeat protein (TIGR01451 family)